MSINQLIFFVTVLFLPLTIWGQSSYVNSPVSLGQGTSGVANTDRWSVLLNPAGSAKADTYSVSVSYYLPYHLNDLSSKNLIGTLPLESGVISAYVSQYGFSLYNESKVGLAYARSIAPKLSASFQLTFQNTHLSQSGSGNQVFSGVGLLYEPTSSFNLGFYVSNPERSEITILEEQTDIPSIFIIGFKWSVSSSFNISGEMEKQGDFNALAKLGMEYAIGDMVWIRTGVFGRPLNYTLGLGVEIYDFRFDVGMAHHNVLGVSSCFGISYLFKKK